MKKTGKVLLAVSTGVVRTLYLVAALAILILVGIKMYDFGYSIFHETVKVPDEVVEYEIEIPKGASAEQIAVILKEKDLIEDEFLFKVKVRLSEYNGAFRYGKYKMTNEMTEEEIMKLLATEGEKRATVTVLLPEGYTIAEMAAVFETKKLCKAEDFIKEANEGSYNYKVLSTLVTSEDRPYKLQGYLSPNTYSFYEDSTTKELIDKLVSETNAVWTAAAYKNAETLGYSVDEIMIIASLIEKEATASEEDRRNIAGVIYNRLKSNMLLQIDATIVYAYALQGEKIAEDGQVLIEHLEIDSPYNTYKKVGLPAGPISNPGKTAINAALNPAEHDYYYYVYNPATKQHEFSKNLDEHNSKVAAIRRQSQ